MVDELISDGTELGFGIFMKLAVDGAEFEVDRLGTRKFLLRSIDDRRSIAAGGVIVSSIEFGKWRADLVSHHVATTNRADSRSRASRRGNVFLVTIVAKFATILVIRDIQSTRGMLHKVGQFLIRSVLVDGKVPSLAALLTKARFGSTSFHE